MSKRNHCDRQGRRTGLRLRLFVFVGIVTLVGATAFQLAFPDLGEKAAADQAMTITMGGFTPNPLQIEANTATTVRLDNPDSSHHSDGGGVHQFAVPELGIDVLIQPRSSKLITIPATAPGTYAFYCDTCCGGKENPSMQGTLIVN